MNDTDRPPRAPLFLPLILPVILTAIISAAGGALFVYFFHLQAPIEPAIAEGITQFRETNNEYDFIRPLLYCRLPESTSLGEKEDLKKEIEKTISELTQSNPTLEASVYYRDLNRGRWIGVNEEKEYTPASLLKVVIMITLFKEVENRKTDLSEEVLFTQAYADLLDKEPLDRGTELEVGKSYTVDDLISRMIVKSDNGAAYALLARIASKNLNQVYRDLELRNPEEVNGAFTINAREYSYFLRILYNSTYLGREMSERALSLLNQAEFHDGLVQGVPPSIPVAHKYGESIPLKKIPAGIIELHDCGIVYHPERPYLLCIMTRGNQVDALLQTIQNISKKVYEDVVAG